MVVLNNERPIKSHLVSKRGLEILLPPEMKIGTEEYKNGVKLVCETKLSRWIQNKTKQNEESRNLLMAQMINPSWREEPRKAK